jgi:hypothetical protein
VTVSTEARKLAAILVADVVGYSRLAGADEDRTLVRLRGLRSDLIDPAYAESPGRIRRRPQGGAGARMSETRKLAAILVADSRRLQPARRRSLAAVHPR